jgi:hypothetical protein
MSDQLQTTAIENSWQVSFSRYGRINSPGLNKETAAPGH